jgi:hypothetical protein
VPQLSVLEQDVGDERRAELETMVAAHVIAEAGTVNDSETAVARIY